MKRAKFKDELLGVTWIISAVAVIYFGGHVLAWVFSGFPVKPF